MGDAPRQFKSAKIEALETGDRSNDLFGERGKGHAVKGNNSTRAQNTAHEPHHGKPTVVLCPNMVDSEVKTDNS